MGGIWAHDVGKCLELDVGGGESFGRGEDVGAAAGRVWERLAEAIEDLDLRILGEL